MSVLWSVRLSVFEFVAEGELAHVEVDPSFKYSRFEHLLETVILVRCWGIEGELMMTRDIKSVGL